MFHVFHLLVFNHHLKQRNHVIELSKIFSEYDFVRLPNIIEHNRSILFDYVRLSSIINVFDYVRLSTPGLQTQQATKKQ